MSATTPGMRHIWMDAVVQCIDQRTANVADVRGPMVQSFSVVDSADMESAAQPAASSAGEILPNLQVDRKTVLVLHNNAKTV